MNAKISQEEVRILDNEPEEERNALTDSPFHQFPAELASHIFSYLRPKADTLEAIHNAMEDQRNFALTCGFFRATRDRVEETADHIAWKLACIETVLRANPPFSDKPALGADQRQQLVFQQLDKLLGRYQETYESARWLWITLMLNHPFILDESALRPKQIQAVLRLETLAMASNQTESRPVNLAVTQYQFQAMDSSKGKDIHPDDWEKFFVLSPAFNGGRDHAKAVFYYLKAAYFNPTHWLTLAKYFCSEASADISIALLANRYVQKAQENHQQVSEEYIALINKKIQEEELVNKNIENEEEVLPHSRRRSSF